MPGPVEAANVYLVEWLEAVAWSLRAAARSDRTSRVTATTRASRVRVTDRLLWLSKPGGSRILLNEFGC